MPTHLGELLKEIPRRGKQGKKFEEVDSWEQSLTAEISTVHFVQHEDGIKVLIGDGAAKKKGGTIVRTPCHGIKVFK